MREFEDESGRRWTAAVAGGPVTDYKGRYHLVLRPADGGPEVELTDIRWNREATAERTLETMSTVELRRRLRSAVGRSPEGVVGGA